MGIHSSNLRVKNISLLTSKKGNNVLGARSADVPQRGGGEEPQGTSIVFRRKAWSET